MKGSDEDGTRIRVDLNRYRVDLNCSGWFQMVPLTTGPITYCKSNSYRQFATLDNCQNRSGSDDIQVKST